MRIISLVFVVLLVSVVFTPVVAAHSMEQSIAKTPIELISSSDTAKEYIVYTDETKDTAKYLIKQEMITADQKQVWKAEVHEIMADGTVSSEVVFGKDSTWWFDADGGLHIHIGSVDLQFLISGGAIALGAFGTWLGGPIGTGTGAALGAALGIAVVAVAYLYSNADGSLDIYMDQLTVTLIPAYLVLPGSQILFIQLGSTVVPLSL